jgi:hypothetical protein
MELASMLAGERFSDHPRAVCPVIAGFLRSYNDRVPASALPELYPLASVVVGSASTWRVRRRRLRRLQEWGRRGAPAATVPLPTALETRDRIVIAAACAAVCMEPQARRAAVADLVTELVAMDDGASRPLDADALLGRLARRREVAERRDRARLSDSDAVRS